MPEHENNNLTSQETPKPLLKKQNMSVIDVYIENHF